MFSFMCGVKDKFTASGKNEKRKWFDDDEDFQRHRPRQCTSAVWYDTPVPTAVIGKGKKRKRVEGDIGGSPKRFCRVDGRVENLLHYMEKLSLEERCVPVMKKEYEVKEILEEEKESGGEMEVVGLNVYLVPPTFSLLEDEPIYIKEKEESEDEDEINEEGRPIGEEQQDDDEDDNTTDDEDWNVQYRFDDFCDPEDELL